MIRPEEYGLVGTQLRDSIVERVERVYRTYGVDQMLSTRGPLSNIITEDGIYLAQPDGPFWGEISDNESVPCPCIQSGIANSMLVEEADSMLRAQPFFDEKKNMKEEELSRIKDLSDLAGEYGDYKLDLRLEKPNFEPLEINIGTKEVYACTHPPKQCLQNAYNTSKLQFQTTKWEFDRQERNVSIYYNAFPT
jgi:hypothetical protein